MAGTGPWTRTTRLSLIRGMLCPLSSTGIDWRGRLGSNQGHPDSESGVLPLNYTPFRWCFPFVSSEPLRLFRPALSPDQLGKHGAPGVDSNARPPAYKAGALPAELRGACVWYSVMVSNHRPPACKTGALPSELTEHGRRGRIRTCISLIKSQDLSPLSYAPCGCWRR